MAKIARSEGIPAAEATEDAVVVRALYRALEEGRVSDLAPYVDPDISWVHPMVARLPFDGARRGLGAVLRNAFLRHADGTGPRVSAGTFIELGDGVLVAGRLTEDRGTEGALRERPFLHECTVRGGRVVLIREYPAGGEGGWTGRSDTG
jgi:ketosteroid isomerase-like protein